MKNDPWIKTASLWLTVSLFTALAVFRLTGGKAPVAEENTGNKEQLAFEEMLKNESEREDRKEGKVIVLKSSFAGLTNEEMTLPAAAESTAKTEAVTLGAAETAESSAAEKKRTSEEVKEYETAVTETAEESLGTEENKTEKETETKNEESTVRETAEKIPETSVPSAKAETFSCTFNSNINRSGRWSAGDDDLFTLEVYGLGSGEIFSMEYYSYDTNKIDALYENYPEPDPAHAAEVSEKFGNNGGVISYRCTDGNDISYINVLPQDRIVAVEGGEEAGMRFYTGEGFNEGVLSSYETAVSGLTVEGDEIVLK